MRINARQFRLQRFDFQTVDTNHGVAIIHQEVREREAGRPHTNHKHPLATRGFGIRRADIERIPSG